MAITLADRIKSLPPYLFAEIDKLKKEERAKGADLIDLGIGDPDIPTPSAIVDAMAKAVHNTAYHRYPSYEGMPRFREAAAAWYQKRFGVKLDPEAEVVALIGSKEGIAHFPVAFTNPGDVNLCTNPGYPVYATATMFSGGVPYLVPLRRENGFLPDLKAIPADVLKKSKILFFNYPNNPTAAVANKAFFEEAAAFCAKNGIIGAHDNAYSEIYFDEAHPPMSYLQVPGAKEWGIEFHSLSKTYNMTGWRIGFAVGNKDLIAGLGKVKTNVDSGAFEAIQEASITAFSLGADVLKPLRETWKRRNAACIEGLRAAGYDPFVSSAAFYVWTPVPKGTTSKQFCMDVLKKTGVVITPGNGFGEHGEGYFRMALTQNEDRIREAVTRMKNL
ncbi:MAG TPA: LL-diaminopimelate aminotransferase [bacterium]|nr:LL-diaminopimelate aminotransferase [bacterium]